MFGEQVPEGGGSCGEGSIASGLVLGSEWWRQEDGIREVEAVRWSVVVEQVGKVGGGV